MAENAINSTTKDKILEATLEIISSQGFQNVTIRKIATVAGVNIAAVNYHFGSKDNVVSAALEYLMVQAKNIFKCLSNSHETPEQRLRNFVDKLAKNFSKYPDQIQYLIYQSIHDQATPNKFQEYLKTEGIDLIKAAIQEIRPAEDDVTLQMRVTQLFGCLAFPVLLGNRSTEIFGVELNDSKKRKTYVEFLLKSIMP
ncbi:MAG TPA: TetR/AcrR family transcriptional regulator [Firmicutes bacterium]|jgi:TetR/AcrR family transcriptional regulator, regulator of cefoperazone and chloramphenicol sensitivity|nr:TetR/AcrR family transcriptional regulator [Bacillota bacterium]